MQPFQMKDGAVRVIRPSAWRKPAVCSLQMGLCSGMPPVLDGAGGGGRRAEKDGA